MLILTRRVGESLMIGRDIAVTIVGIRGGQVRIGIEAPRATAVHRKELYDRLQSSIRIAPKSVLRPAPRLR